MKAHRLRRFSKPTGRVLGNTLQSRSGAAAGVIIGSLVATRALAAVLRRLSNLVLQATAVRLLIVSITSEKYKLLTRLYLIPGLGAKRLDRLQVRDVRTWLNNLRVTCQCCAQGKDARRPTAKQRCCATSKCCHQVVGSRTIKDIRDTLRAALSNAVAEELVTRNVAAVVRLPTPRKAQRESWSAEEARRFLESARTDEDPLYAAYVLVLVLGLRAWRGAWSHLV
jgi:hypothetical protein